MCMSFSLCIPMDIRMVHWEQVLSLGFIFAICSTIAKIPNVFSFSFFQCEDLLFLF